MTSKGRIAADTCRIRLIISTARRIFPILYNWPAMSAKIAPFPGDMGPQSPPGWLGSRVVSLLDSGAEGPGFKSQPRRCRVTVLVHTHRASVHQAAKLVAALFLSLSAQSTQFCSYCFYCIVFVLINKIFVHSFIVSEQWNGLCFAGGTVNEKRRERR